MNILFLGGDKRHKYASDYIKVRGLSSNAILQPILNEENISYIKSADVIILPLPVTKNGTDLNVSDSTPCNVRILDLLDCVSSDTLIIGGAFTEQICSFMAQRKQSYVDYYKDDWFQVQNALLSAEGAIYYAKEKFDGSIHGSSIAILGFGKIGKILAFLLSTQGAKITVYARKDNDCSWSKLMGFEAVKIKNSFLDVNKRFTDDGYDIIMNTVPDRIINREFIEVLNKLTILIDLASHPYCVDESLVSEYGIKYYREPGIPGRYAPKAAGEILGNTIINIINGE